MKKSRMNFIIILALLLVFSNKIYINNVYAYEIALAEEKTNEEDEITISVAVFELGQAFFFDDKRQKYSGYLVDYLNELSRYENIKFEYVFGTWQESLDRVENGEVDLCPFVTKTDERLAKFDFSKHSYGPDGGFLYTNRDDIFFDDYGNFEGKKIGFIEGFQLKNDFQEFALKNNFKYFPVFFKDESSMIQSLESHKIDMITAECMQEFKEYRRVARYQMGEYYFASSQDNKLLEIINNALSFQCWYNPNIDLQLYQKYYKLTDENPIFNRQEMDYIEEKEVLTIAIIPNRYVQSKYDFEKKVFTGIEPDIVRNLEELSGLNIEMVAVKDKESLISMVEKGYSDMAMGLSHIDGLTDNSKFIYTDEILDTPHVLAIRKNDDFDSKKTNIIAIPKTFYAAKIFMENEFPDWKIIQDYSLADRLDSLIDLEADCTLISRYELQYLLQKPKYRELTMYPVDFMNFDSSIIISTQVNPNVVTILNKSIENLKYNSIDSIINNNISNINYYYTFWDNIIEYKEFVIIIVILLLGLFLILYFSYHIQKRKSIELEGYVRELNKSNYKLNLANAQIKEAEKIANEASRIKSEFMARMSHDMRTPMNAIISISDFGMEESINSSDIDYFKQIKTSSLYLLGLLNDILETQKLESDEIELIDTVFNYSVLFNEIENIIKYKALRKHIEFITDFDNRYDMYNIFSDKKRLEQVIINIINNAVKYTKPFGKVVWKTRIKKYQKSIKITHTISDNGVGMTEEFQSKMFDPFTQENNELSDNEFGTGLGLAIVKNIINLMGGSIKCKSKIGNGTKFTIIIEHEISDEPIKDNANSCKYYSNILAGKKILVCEDNDINSKIILKILGKHDIITDLAENGKIGVEKTINNEYDLILMDIRMPIMDGLEAAKEIRKFDNKVPIIALSANAYEEDVRKSLYAGMNAHIAKPIDKDELFSNIVYWIFNK